MFFLHLFKILIQMRFTTFVVGILLTFTVAIFSSCKKNDSGNGSQGSLSGEWQQTNGPCGGTIGGIAITGNTIYVGYGGLSVTSNFGNSWTQVTNGTSGNVPAQAILIHNDTIMTEGNGVFRSTDNGKTWTQLGQDVITCCILTMAWSGQTIVLCTYNYGPLFISNDNGLTWNASGNSIPDYSINGAAILGSNIYAATGSHGVYISTDNGQTYTASNNGLSNLSVNSLVTNENNIYAGTNGGLFVSANEGKTWSNINNSMLNNMCISQIVISGPTILVGGYNGLVYSKDNGATWTQAITGLADQRITSMAVNGSTFFAGTYSGIYMSVNSGQTWNAIGLPVTYVHSFAWNGSNLFACASGLLEGVFNTPDYGQDWNFLPGGSPDYNVYSVFFNGTEMLAATDSGVFISTDLGQSWTKKSHGIPVDEYSTVTCVAGNGSNLYAGTYSYGIFVSHDGGVSWTHATLPVKDEFYAICFYINSSGIFAGTFFGGILFSSDNGQTWTSMSSGLPAMTAYSSIVQAGSRLFAGSIGGVYSSGDNGHSWGSAGSELNGKEVTSLATNGTDIIAATSANGVYMSKDQGSSWFQINNGFPANTQASCVAMNGSWLFVGTNGQGVWRHPYSH
jgi:photosystem II stability/assembly factor-like uncharacterized protein